MCACLCVCTSMCVSIVIGEQVFMCFSGQSLGLCAVFILIFGLLSAAPVPNTKQFGYPWLLVCRFGVGIAAGGSSQSCVVAGVVI